MTKPENVIKYCPRCGSSKFTFEGEKSFICEDCRFNFFINSAAAASGLIVNPQGKLLLTIRAIEPGLGMLDLPGGFVDPLESVEQAMAREIKEELNLDVISMKYMGSYPNRYIFSGITVYTCDMGFICEVEGWNDIKVMDDVADITFVDADFSDFNKVIGDTASLLIKDFWKLKNTN